MSNPPLTKFSIDLQPLGKRVEIGAGKTLLDAANQSGAGMVSLCGGEGWCYSCVCKIIAGKVNAATGIELECFSDEEITAGLRLACQVVPESDLVVDIPPDSLTTPQRLQIEGLEIQVKLDPYISYVDLEIPIPSLNDLESDTSRVQAALRDAGFENTTVKFPGLANFSDILRKLKWKVRIVLHGNEMIAVLPYESELYGLAVDIGTTKIAIYLLSLISGEVVDKVGEMNPQVAYGEDVISRIAYTNQNDNGRLVMQQLVVETLNTKITEVCKREKITADQIVDAVVVCNTAIHHLFAGLPVSQLVEAPYVPAVSNAIDIQANGIGLNISSSAYVHLLPNIAGYVGADHAAVMLSTELWTTKKTVIVIDIGTNTEISLATKGRILSCSCASGPAFEGAHIKHGMRAAPGAIERIQIVNEGEIHIFTINDQPPVGICGSGILDAVAELKKAKVINDRGAFITDHPQVRRDQKNRQEYLLVEAGSTGHGKDVTVTRIDINEIQLAKGAIRAGLEILLSEAGILAEDVDEIIVAGAFGTYIDVSNAVKIGMFPDVPLQRFRQVGNAAGMGARLALLSKERRSMIQGIVEQVEYIELTTYPDFQDEFLRAMYL